MLCLSGFELYSRWVPLIYILCCSDWDFEDRPNPLEIVHLFPKRWLDFSCSVFARTCEEYKHLVDSTNLGLVYALSCSFLSLWLLCKQHLNHGNLRVDLVRDKCWSVFSPSQSSEFCTTTLPPQQANAQRMRLKMYSNPKVDKGGQHPITDDHYESWKPNEFFSLGVHLYSYSRIWVKWNNSSHSSSVKRPIRLTQCCTQFKSPGVKILCVLYLHDNVAFTFKWYGNSWNKTFYPQRLSIGYNI